MVPFIISTYLNNSLYFSLLFSYNSSLSTESHIIETSASGIPNALPTSLIAPLSATVLNVTISQQYRPVFENIYCFTSSILDGGKSVSISERLTLSVFMKRSKFRLCLILSISVIPSSQAITLPFTDPLPYPTIISFSIHQLMISSISSMKSIAPLCSYAFNSCFILSMYT